MKKPRKVKAAGSDGKHTDLLDGLRSLGLTTATAQVGAVMKQLYPFGVSGIDEGEVLRAVFLHIKRQNSADNLP